MQYINNPDTPVFSNPNKPVIPAVPKLRPDTPSSTDKTPGRKAMRTELSINDIRSSAWNATQGSPTSYQFLQEQNRKLAKIANSRLKALKAADLDMFAYDRAITYLNNRGLKQFQLKLASADDFQGMVNQLSELITFINSKTSTVKGAREALDAKLEKISEYFDVSDIAKDDIESTLMSLTHKKAYVMCRKGGKFSLLVLKDTPEAKSALDELNPGKSDAYKGLDVTVLHTLILEKLFGIDKENMANQINLRYTRVLDEAVSAVESDEYNCSFILNSTKVSEIKDVALAGEKMPQKSTYFYPKLITGLVMNELQAQDA